MSATATETIGKTAQQVIDHLVATGTGPGRIEKLKAMLVDEPQCTAAEMLEWMISQDFPRGTVLKVGCFLNGVTWTLNQPGVEVSSELASLKRENAELKDQLRQANANNGMLTRSNQELIRRNAVLSELDTPQKIKRLEKPVAAGK